MLWPRSSSMIVHHARTEAKPRPTTTEEERKTNKDVVLPLLLLVLRGAEEETSLFCRLRVIVVDYNRPAFIMLGFFFVGRCAEVTDAPLLPAASGGTRSRFIDVATAAVEFKRGDGSHDDDEQLPSRIISERGR